MKWGSAGSAAVVALALLVAGATVGVRILNGDQASSRVEPQHEALLVSSTGMAGLDVAPQRPVAAQAFAPTEVPPPTATPEPTATPLPPEPTATPVPPTPAPAPPTATPEPVEQAIVAPTATPVPPTATPVPPTPTPVPPTATPLPPTATPRPPTATPTLTPRATVQALAAMVATATRTPIATRTPTAVPYIPGSVTGKATPYSDSLAGNNMGCMGAGKYSITDTTVIAVSAAQHTMFPCGIKLEVCGPNGCIVGYRKDSCPGCGPGDVDLSRAGFYTVCGRVNNCAVRTRSIP